jgi:hypothetical protein
MNIQRTILSREACAATSRPLRTTVAVIFALVHTALTLTAATGPRKPTTATHGHIRSDAPLVQWLLTKGARYSSTLSDLVESLEATDVIVYVKMDPRMPRTLGGKTTFLTAALDCRYILITLASNDDVISTAIILGHELAHASEIALDPSIVDERSMLNAYMPHVVGMRGGKPRRHRTGTRRNASDST